MIIYIKNYKGGVAKSTVTKNLAHGTALTGMKTLIITFDTQNDSYRMLTGKRWTGKNGLKSLVRTGEEDFLKIRDNLDYYPLETDVFGPSLKKKLIECIVNFKKTYDVVFIDGAPSANNLLDRVGVEVSDKILVPMIMDAYSIDGLANFIGKGELKKVSMVIPTLFANSEIQKMHYKEFSRFLYVRGIKISEPIRKINAEEKLNHIGKSIFETKRKDLNENKNNYIEILKETFND